MNDKKFQKKKQKYELKLQRKQEIKDLKGKYSEQSTSKKMFQYSKVLTTIILLITLLWDSYFILYLVPKSGVLTITDQAINNLGTVIMAWNAGTVLFFCVYFAKALFETKFEKDNELLSVNKVVDEIQEGIEKAVN